jgi:hypothetical protein
MNNFVLAATGSFVRNVHACDDSVFNPSITLIDEKKMYSNENS